MLGFNRPVDAATAEVLAEPGRSSRRSSRPTSTPAALEILTTKPKWKANVRLMKVGPLDAAGRDWQLRQIEGGMLVQEADVAGRPRERVESRHRRPARRRPAGTTCGSPGPSCGTSSRTPSSLAKDRMLLGAGAGQMSRVDSVEIAIKKAGDRGRGRVLASDAFFPFPDSIEQAAAAGVAAIIQPGGSRTRRRSDRRLQRAQIADDLHRPAALQALERSGRPRWPSVLDKIVATKRRKSPPPKLAQPEATLRASWPPRRRRRGDFFARAGRARADSLDRRSEKGQPLGRA